MVDLITDAGCGAWDSVPQHYKPFEKICQGGSIMTTIIEAVVFAVIFTVLRGIARKLFGN